MSLHYIWVSTADGMTHLVANKCAMKEHRQKKFIMKRQQQELEERERKKPSESITRLPDATAVFLRLQLM